MWSTIWQNIMYILLGLIAGGAAGFFIARYVFKKQLKENPPINEKQIRVMFRMMGQKPSEARIKQIMKAMEENR